MLETPYDDVAKEMAEYASFPITAQLYIIMVLDCVLERGAWRDRWRPEISPQLVDRTFANFAIQRELREHLQRFWQKGEGDGQFMPLVMTSSWDIAVADIQAFSHYRFLYERLYGPEVCPLLPSSFAASVLLPHVPLERRMALLATITSDTIAPCNQIKKPAFFPASDVLVDDILSRPRKI